METALQTAEKILSKQLNKCTPELRELRVREFVRDYIYFFTRDGELNNFSNMVIETHKLFKGVNHENNRIA